MPQTKVEKKFLQTTVGKNNYNFAPSILQNPLKAVFQGLGKNQNGGAE